MGKQKMEFIDNEKKVNLKKQSVIYLVYFMENMYSFYSQTQVKYYKHGMSSFVGTDLCD